MAFFTCGVCVPLVIWFALRATTYLRTLYAVGSNDATAFSSGVNVDLIRIAAYALGGLFAFFFLGRQAGFLSRCLPRERRLLQRDQVAVDKLGDQLLEHGVFFGEFKHTSVLQFPW